MSLPVSLSLEFQPQCLAAESRHVLPAWASVFLIYKNKTNKQTALLSDSGLFSFCPEVDQGWMTPLCTLGLVHVKP